MSDLSLHGAAFTELILEIFRVNRLLLDAGDRLTEPVGLTSARWQVLGVVEHGPASVAHIARIMGLARQSVQQTADGLERDGLIAYRENPHHRRAKLIVMTPKGGQALGYVQHRQADWASQIGGEQALEDLRTAATVLHQVRASLERSRMLAAVEDELP